MDKLFTENSDVFVIVYVGCCLIMSAISLFVVWKDEKLQDNWQGDALTKTQTPNTYTGVMMPGNIIVITNRLRMDSVNTENALKISRAVGISPYTTYTETTSASAYWRMAKKIGLFEEVDLQDIDTVVLVVDRYDEICDGAIDPDVETLHRFTGMVIAPDKPAPSKQPPQLSPLTEDAMSGPRPRRV